ncbi:MAG: hypothetical protein ACLKAK_08220 [Alkaliphilus sp.]
MANWEHVGDIAVRCINNPIIKTNANNSWETELVYNTAALKIEDTVYLIYRAMGDDHIARFGLAYSKDGINFERFNFSIMRPSEYYELPHEIALKRERERGGIEDPRATIIDDTIYLYYTSFHKKCHISMASINVENFIKLVQESKENPNDYSKKWNDSWKRHGLVFPKQFEDDNVFSRNAVLHKLKKDLFMLLYRVDKGNINYSFASTPIGPWQHNNNSLIEKDLPWEAERIGISTPSIEIEDRGKKFSLFFYHGVEAIGGGIERRYHLSAFLLESNLEKDELIIHKLLEPIMSPKTSYEVNSKWLDPCGVEAIFSCGAVLISNDIFIYYGAGDSVICLAKVTVDEILRMEKKMTVVKI